MTKKNKDLSNIPLSLIPPVVSPSSSSPRTPSQTTQNCRQDLVDNGNYINSNKYNARYKTEDVKQSLDRIYNHKCAFCEQIVEQLHVEHFRPKKTYYWLAYSWDNLILACPACNQHKGNNFELKGNQVAFGTAESWKRRINHLSILYDRIEKPKMVNPELIDPSGKLIFCKDGSIESSDSDMMYTIVTCGLNRTYLKDARRKILDTFRNDIVAEMLRCEDSNSQACAIRILTERFVRKAQDDSNEFSAFRRYFLLNGAMAGIVKDILKDMSTNFP